MAIAWLKARLAALHTEQGYYYGEKVQSPQRGKESTQRAVAPTDMSWQRMPISFHARNIAHNRSLTLISLGKSNYDRLARAI